MTPGRLFQIAKIVLGLAIFLLALYALHDVVAGYQWHDLFRFVRDRGAPSMVLAALLAISGYLIMTGYDSIAFRYIDHPLPYRWIALASFTAYAINNNLGLSGVIGTALRYRFYRRWGVANAKIVRVFVFCTFTYWLGFAILGGSIFLLWPPPIPGALRMPFGSIRVMGAVLLVPALAYFSWIVIRGGPIRWRRFEVALPNRTIFVAQVAISIADWVIAGSVLYTILPSPVPTSFVTTLGMFLLAQIAGLVSNVPGGLGVFEAILVVFLRPYFSTSEIVSSLVAFRGIYFLLPLMPALLLLGAHEAVTRVRR